MLVHIMMASQVKTRIRERSKETGSTIRTFLLEFKEAFNMRQKLASCWLELLVRPASWSVLQKTATDRLPQTDRTGQDKWPSEFCELLQSNHGNRHEDEDHQPGLSALGRLRHGSRECFHSCQASQRGGLQQCSCDRQLQSG